MKNKFVGYGVIGFLGLLVAVGLAVGNDPVTDPVGGGGSRSRVTEVPVFEGETRLADGDEPWTDTPDEVQDLPVYGESAAVADMDWYAYGVIAGQDMLDEIAAEETGDEEWDAFVTGFTVNFTCAFLEIGVSEGMAGWIELGNDLALEEGGDLLSLDSPTEYDPAVDPPWVAMMVDQWPTYGDIPENVTFDMFSGMRDVVCAHPLVDMDAFYAEVD